MESIASPENSDYYLLKINYLYVVNHMLHDNQLITPQNITT